MAVEQFTIACILRVPRLAPGGGYICGPGQVLTDDIRTENAIALYETALEYGRY
ncbi:MAG: hypothetical protein NTU94_04935 [Planctomycetota bacterium]|nr:hypothetical protein [Planctomycetota bacterium]